jgi:hypothetical protein
MATHPKNNEYVRKWRELNRAKYLEQDKRSVLKIYYYKKGINELMRIDPTLFL